MDHVETPKCFLVKKYILMSLCLVYIIFLAVYPFVERKIGEYELSENERDHETVFWRDTMITLIALSATGIVLQLLGMLIVWNERFYLLGLFAALQLFAIITNVVQGFYISSTISLAIFCLSMCFFYDLYVLKQDVKQLEMLEKHRHHYWIRRWQMATISSDSDFSIS